MIGGVSEYLASFLLDVFFHIRFWDYTGYFLNIHGRTTIPFMVVWGIFGTFLMKVIVPFLSKWVEKIPYRIGVIFTSFLIFFLSFDIILSFGAFVRFCERKKAHEPISFVGSFYDRVYPDDFLIQKFPILNGK